MIFQSKGLDLFCQRPVIKMNQAGFSSKMQRNSVVTSHLICTFLWKSAFYFNMYFLAKCIYFENTFHFWEVLFMSFHLICHMPRNCEKKFLNSPKFAETINRILVFLRGDKWDNLLKKTAHLSAEAHSASVDKLDLSSSANYLQLSSRKVVTLWFDL